MAVHYGGSVIDVQALRRRLPKGVFIVEDAAHALGGAYPDGSRAGSSGNLACFSFYPNKNLATAEGGAVALRDGRLADRLRSLRQHALPINAWRRFTDPKTLLLSGGLTELGYKMNFTDLQAAIARVQLRRQPSLDARRRAIASVYARRIGRAGLGLELQRGLTDAAHARHLAVLMLPSHLGGAPRDGLLRELRVRNIGAAIHYAPLHRMALYGRRPRRLPVTEDVYPRILTLPISASMTTVDAEYVCEHLLDILGSLTGR
jgi:dTDP-4-amino-4,6-dideoxygalactose transaminase